MNLCTAMAGLRKWLQTGPVSHELNLAASYYYMDFTNGGACYAVAPSNLYHPVATPRRAHPPASIRRSTPKTASPAWPWPTPWAFSTTAFC